jgi:MFS family permease
MITVALFRNRTFSAANAVSLFMYAGLFGATFLVSQFLQTGLGESPLAAGIRLLPWAGTPMVVMPLAGILADRSGNRTLMALGLTLQGVGLAWLAWAAAPGMAYWQIGVALTIAGIGTSLCFPTVANAVLGSVPLEEAGVAVGTNSAIREVGGVLGVAVLASVFARHGVYTSHRIFADGFKAAIWVAVGFSAAGAAAALLTARSPHPQKAEAEKVLIEAA